MKLLVVLCLVAVAVSALPADRPTVYIVKYNNENFSDGKYSYSYEQSDNTKVEQYGQLKNAGTKEEALEVSGRFQWTSPQGITYTVTYTAGEDGYKPEVEEGPGISDPALATLLG